MSDGPDFDRILKQGRLNPSIPEHKLYIERALAFYAATDLFAELSEVYGKKAEELGVELIVPVVTIKTKIVGEDRQEPEIVEEVVEEVVEEKPKKRGRPKKAPVVEPETEELVPLEELEKIVEDTPQK